MNIATHICYTFSYFSTKAFKFIQTFFIQLFYPKKNGHKEQSNCCYFSRNALILISM